MKDRSLSFWSEAQLELHQNYIHLTSHCKGMHLGTQVKYILLLPPYHLGGFRFLKIDLDGVKLWQHIHH